MTNKLEPKIQYGCGWTAPKEWINFDASPTLRFERIPILGSFYTKNIDRFPANVKYGDITKGLPISDHSASAVYCSHVLEHLSLEDLRKALKNTKKILKPGGIFRLVMPDIETLAKGYLERTDCNAAIDFMRDSYLGVEFRPRGAVGLLKAWLGNSGHLWMWDYKSMQQELANAGFSGIRRAYFGDDESGIFDPVETEERWKMCLGIRCEAHLT